MEERVLDDGKKFHWEGICFEQGFNISQSIVREIMVFTLERVPVRTRVLSIQEQVRYYNRNIEWGEV